MLGIEWDRYIELKEERPELFKNEGVINIVLDEAIVENYQIENDIKIGVVYDSPYNMMVVDLVYNEEGVYYSYERVIPKEQKGAVVILPRYKGEYILLKQYRHSIRDYQYAFPRGYAERGISAEENVQKEMYEELGAEISNVRYMGEVIADSGLSANKVSIYECEVKEYREIEKNEGIVEFVEVSFEEIIKMMEDNRLDDGYTLSAIAMQLSKGTISKTIKRT